MGKGKIIGDLGLGGNLGIKHFRLTNKTQG